MLHCYNRLHSGLMLSLEFFMRRSDQSYFQSVLLSAKDNLNHQVVSCIYSGSAVLNTSRVVVVAKTRAPTSPTMQFFLEAGRC
jgi:hypothetical protein